MTGRFLKISLLALATAFCLAGCEKDDRGIKGKGDNNGDDPDVVVSTTPADAPNKVVAHRGGSAECGLPDNSRASLKYAQALKCYASECDIYWTKDNDIIIAHAQDTYYVNGLKPWEHTVDEIRKAGLLKNGESIPTLGDFLDIVMVEGKCTRLWLDIKALGSDTEHPKKAVDRACEIIKERGAQKWCEFICTSNQTVANAASADMVVYGIPVGWMGNYAPANHKALGFTWANLSAASHMTPYGSGSRTVDEFVNAGMQISVFNVDKKNGDGNAVYSEEAVNYYVSQYPKMKAICTNYPSWLISKVK